MASSARRYDYAVKHFLWFCVAYLEKLADKLGELDVQCSVFTKISWEERERRRLVAVVLSGLGPGPQRMRILPVGWSWLNVWERHKTPNRASPLACTQVLAMNGLLVHFGLRQMAWLLPIGFAACFAPARLLR